MGDLREGDHVTLAKGDVERIETIRSWVMDIWHIRWWLAGLMGLLVAFIAFRWFDGEERREWMSNSWDFAELLVPLLFGGVFVVGFIAALLPGEEVAKLVGDNGLSSNFIASIVGALFYFATLTEIPVVQALTEHGMAEGPALALLLAGPALSLPNVLVIGKVLGAQKTFVFCALAVVMAMTTGLIYGAIVG